jgi:phosphonate transport system substrate-binding protein
MLAIALLGPVRVASAAEPVYRFGVVPQHTAEMTRRLWAPLVAELGARTGHAFQLVTSADIQGFEQALRQGEFDVAYMNPFHYTVFHRNPGYLPVAHARDQPLQGIVVVRTDSPIRGIEDLAGQTLAFPAPNAFAAAVLPQAVFKLKALSVTPAYLGSHDAVYQAVAQGRHVAGGGIPRTLNAVAPEIREHLRVIWTSAEFTPHAIASHPRLPESLRQALQAALVGMAGTAAGRAALEALDVAAWVPAEDTDWDDIRSMHIELP